MTPSWPLFHKVFQGQPAGFEQMGHRFFVRIPREVSSITILLPRWIYPPVQACSLLSLDELPVQHDKGDAHGHPIVVSQSKGLHEEQTGKQQYGARLAVSVMKRSMTTNSRVCQRLFVASWHPGQASAGLPPLHDHRFDRIWVFR